MEDYGRQLTLLVAARLDELRRDRGLSLEDLAALAGMHRTSVGLAFRGRRGLTVDTSARLARALGMNLSEIIRYAEQALVRE